MLFCLFLISWNVQGQITTIVVPNLGQSSNPDYEFRGDIDTAIIIFIQDTNSFVLIESDTANFSDTLAKGDTLIFTKKKVYNKAYPSGKTIDVVERKFHIALKSDNGIKNKFQFKKGSDNRNSPRSKIIYKNSTLYYDALALSEPGISRNDIDTIIRKYNITELEENKFLSKIFHLSSTAGRQALTNISIEQSISSLGGLDVTKYADGLAKFLVKRTKEELNIAFFEKFKEEIEKNPDLNDLFPHTANMLKLIGEEIYNYQRYVTTLREEFENDLKMLPENFPKIIKNHRPFFSEHKGLDNLIISSSEFAKNIRDEVHPGHALEGFETSGIGQLDTNLRASLETIKLFSKALRDTATTENSNYWVSKEQIRKLVSDKKTFRIFLGLVREVAKQEQIWFKTDSLYVLMDRVAEKWDETESYYEEYRSFFSDLSSKTEKLNTLIKRKKVKDDEKMSLTELLSLFNAGVDIIEAAEGIAKLLPENTPDIDIDQLERVVKMCRNFSDLVVNVSKSKYGSAVINVLNLYDLIASKKYYELRAALEDEVDDKQFKEIKKRIKATNQFFSWSDEKFEKFLIDIQDKDSSFIKAGYRIIIDKKNKSDIDSIRRYFDEEWIEGEGGAIKARVLKYATFLASMAQAESSDDIADVIEAFALPSGSARIKRESGPTISLNAFVGPYGGYEFEQGSISDNGTFGLTAPVGVAFSWGKDFGIFKSFSIYTTLIDIGAITAYRFTDNETTSPKIFLREIFSPGIFTSFGIGKVLSLNLGYQRPPLLQKVNEDATEVNLNYRGRISTSLVVDIPLLNFHAKSK